jgi:DNA-binding transcriptional LysR family regulator
MQSIKNDLALSINFEQLRTFSLVLELGSFSAAAERLGVTQPAVSVQVKQLERRLGVRLIERVGRRVGATPAGADLMAELPNVATALTNAINAATFHSAGVAGRVRLGTGGTGCLYLLPPVLRDLRARYPLLDIIVSTGNTERLCAARGRQHGRRRAGHAACRLARAGGHADPAGRVRGHLPARQRRLAGRGHRKHPRRAPAREVRAGRQRAGHRGRLAAARRARSRRR